MNGTYAEPLLSGIPASAILERIRRRSEESIYNHPHVAEVVAAGFEMVSGMLDIFVPCADELARERRGGGAASCRSRRLGALLPEPVFSAAPVEGTSDEYLLRLRVLDFISGMTDGFAVNLYQKLKGITL